MVRTISSATPEARAMIAISYRREDSLPIAGRLYDRLEAKFGKPNVFMDFDSIRPGLDFREQIKETIERSNVVVAMIGPNWLGEQSDGSRRIDDPTDFVRLEIEYALKRGIPVIPVLINNTPMPKAEKLPPDIDALAFRHALPLDSGLDFHQHADRLINGICGLVDVSGKGYRVEQLSEQLVTAFQQSSETAEQHRIQEDTAIRRLFGSLHGIPFEDTDHIPSSQFDGSPTSLQCPIPVSRASVLANILEFEIIDLIKRGYLKGVRHDREWYFDLNQVPNQRI